MPKKIKIKVVVAMSGGVDSSVAAALLKRAGFDVVGVFMKFWSEPKKGSLEEGWNRCCSLESEIRARKVAKILKIPFYVLNFKKEFKKKIVDYFLEEHKTGKTPNPCIVCNKEIKFGLLLKKVFSLGADFVATGHYALKRELKTQNLQLKTYHLYRGKDKNKDQSYFLWKLSQQQLKSILFSVGNYTKPQVRKLAKKFKLPVFDTPESQEICFIEKDINDFLSRHLKSQPGKIVDERGEMLGKHRGLHFYTIGQRKGIKVEGGPWYVLDKDLKRNFLIVTKNEKDLETKELIAKEINWLSGEKPKLPLKIKAKIRSRSPLVPAKVLQGKGNSLKVIFDIPQKAITPGQSVVFYLPTEASAKAGNEEELVGGGIISEK